MDHNRSLTFSHIPSLAWHFLAYCESKSYCTRHSYYPVSCARWRVMSPVCRSLLLQQCSYSALLPQNCLYSPGNQDVQTAQYTSTQAAMSRWPWQITHNTLPGLLDRLFSTDWARLRPLQHHSIRRASYIVKSNSLAPLALSPQDGRAKVTLLCFDTCLLGFGPRSHDCYQRQWSWLAIQFSPSASQ